MTNLLSAAVLVVLAPLAAMIGHTLAWRRCGRVWTWTSGHPWNWRVLFGSRAYYQWLERTLGEDAGGAAA